MNSLQKDNMDPETSESSISTWVPKSLKKEFQFMIVKVETNQKQALIEAIQDWVNKNEVIP